MSFMARLLITDDAVTIDMSRGEKLEAGHRNQALPVGLFVSSGIRPLFRHGYGCVPVVSSGR
jgi:hypothetical protein